jgi:hypothetical protein
MKKIHIHVFRLQLTPTQNRYEYDIIVTVRK